MSKVREVKRRIRSVENTKQITRTMEMVSTSKLKRAQDRVVGARPYARALADVIGDLYSPDLAERFPLLRQPEGRPSRVALVLITSNRGLCGGFNGNLIRETRLRRDALLEAGATVDLHLIGKKGIGFFRFVGVDIASARIDIGDRPTMEHAEELSGTLMAAFETGAVDAVEIVYAEFRSAMSTPAVRSRILPITPPAASGHVADYLLSPSADEIVGSLLPLYVRNQIFGALVESAAGEHAARRVAMKNATDNAGEMLDNLRRTYNRARQAQITQEIAEIVGGAEALKG